MAELRSLLVFLDEEERSRVIEKYNSMFDEAGPDGTEALVRCFGSPVRQVLIIEQEYREAKENGEVPFAAPVAAPVWEAEPADNAEEEPIRELEEAPVVGGAPAGDDSDDLMSQEEWDALFNTEEEDEEPAPAEETEPTAEPEEAPEELTEEQPEEAEAPTAEDEAVAAILAPVDEEEPEEEEPAEEEPLREIPAEEPEPEESEDYEDDEEEEDDEDDEDDERAPRSAGKIVAAVLVTLPMLAVWTLLFGLTILLGGAVVLLGVGCGAAALYFAGYVFSGVLSYVPHALLVGGASLAALGLALLLFWLGLWIIILGFGLTIRLTKKIYGGILDGDEDDEDDEDDDEDDDDDDEED